MQYIIEIRAAEGGNDAKLLVKDQAKIYLAYARRNSLFEADILDETESSLTLIISGQERTCSRYLLENGGHRWQRIPPTERSGRVQTSTVTVFVSQLSDNPETSCLLSRDLEIRFTTAGGPGGQHQNRTLSACHVKHIPTGLTAVSRSERSQPQNKRIALQILESRIQTLYNESRRQTANTLRKDSIGSGQRGDKVKTYRVKDNSVVCHLSGCKYRLSEVLKGNI